MDRVINAARLGRPASMILKNNSISDRDIILKLEEASCAGVRIDMIVRGICCVCAGVPGKTENLHIRSLVGRYLEHGRIYSFYDGVNTRIYIASGDFLTRNTECRVEVGVRVEDPVLKEKLTASSASSSATTSTPARCSRTAATRKSSQPPASRW